MIKNHNFFQPNTLFQFMFAIVFVYLCGIQLAFEMKSKKFYNIFPLFFSRQISWWWYNHIWMINYCLNEMIKIVHKTNKSNTTKNYYDWQLQFIFVQTFLFKRCCWNKQKKSKNQRINTFKLRYKFASTSSLSCMSLALLLPLFNLSIFLNKNSNYRFKLHKSS